MAHDAKKWTVGGDAGVSAGSFSSCNRFDNPHTLPAWRSECVSQPWPQPCSCPLFNRTSLLPQPVGATGQFAERGRT